MANFDVYIENEFAFTLTVPDEQQEMVSLMKLGPRIIRADTFGVKKYDSYINRTFIDQDGLPVIRNENREKARFAFIVDNSVEYVVELPKTDQMLLAAFSSHPEFRLATND